MRGCVTSSIGVLQMCMSKDLIHCTECIVALCNSFIPFCRSHVGALFNDACCCLFFISAAAVSGDCFNPYLWSMCPVLPRSVRSLFNTAQLLVGRSWSGTCSVGFSIKFSLSGLLIFYWSFHFVFALNFSETNFSASLQIDIRDF